MVTIEWFAGRTPQQKATLAKQITQAFVEETNVPAEHIWIVFRDVPKSEWAMGGVLQG